MIQLNLTLQKGKSIFNLNNLIVGRSCIVTYNNVTQNRREMKKISHVEEKNC